MVGAAAARAIRVLEQLQPPDVDLLFTVLDHSPSNSRATGQVDAALSTTVTNHQLNDFIQWVNEYCASHGRHDGIPAINNRFWRLSTRQFRRTLAWFIARRPSGSIAGAIAYRHHSVHMFEGYAGTSDSGFRAEVESEQALARSEHLLAMINAYQHKNLAGPAAEEADRRLSEFGEQARFHRKVIVDERRLQRLISATTRRSIPTSTSPASTRTPPPSASRCNTAAVTCALTSTIAGPCPAATSPSLRTTSPPGTPRSSTSTPNSPPDHYFRPYYVTNSRHDASRSPHSSPATTRKIHEPHRRHPHNRTSPLHRRQGARRSLEQRPPSQRPRRCPPTRRVQHTTFRRHFPDLAQEIGEARRTLQTENPAATEHARFITRNAKLRRDNRQLREHLGLAGANIRRLTLTVHNLQLELEATSNITRIDTKTRTS